MTRQLRGCGYEKVESYKRKLMLDALNQAANNQSAAARLCHLSYHQYHYYLGKHQS